MAVAPIGKVPERLWLCTADSNRTRILSRALAKGLDMTVYMGPTMDQDGPVAIIVADDAHSAYIAQAKSNAAPGQRSILVTAGGKQTARADIYLPADIDAGSLANAIAGLSAFRDQQLGMARAKLEGPGAARVIGDAEFQIQTLAEAQELAVFLAGVSPKPCQTAVGLFCIFASAIEHGNLEFTAEEKAQGLAEGKWNQKLAKRMGERLYEGRMVKIRYQRGRRLMSLLIQDDGEGIDAETAEMANPTRGGFRGKLIKLSKALSFGSVNYVVVGNTVEATMVLPEASASAGQPAVAGMR